MGIEEVGASEELLYQHSKALVKIFGVGGEAGENQQERIRENLKGERGGVPAMTGLRKDHKVGWDKVEGPPTRPLVNGKQGANAGLGNLVSRILRPLRKEAVKNGESEVVSTEELLRWIEEFKKEREERGGEFGGF